MNSSLAKYITGLIVDDIDHRTPKYKMCMSSFECEALEKAFIEEKFDKIEAYIKSKFTNTEKDSDKDPLDSEPINYIKEADL